MHLKRTPSEHVQPTRSEPEVSSFSKQKVRTAPYDSCAWPPQTTPLGSTAIGGSPLLLVSVRLSFSVIAVGLNDRATHMGLTMEAARQAGINPLENLPRQPPRSRRFCQ